MGTWSSHASASLVVGFVLASCSPDGAEPEDEMPDVLRWGGPPPHYVWKAVGRDEGVRFRAGSVEVGEEGLEASSLRLEDGGLLARAKVGDWADNTTIYLVLDLTPKGWRARSVGLWWSGDLPPFIGWIRPLKGEIVVDSDSCDPDRPLRCAARLDRFRGEFELLPSETSRELADSLRHFYRAPEPARGG